MRILLSLILALSPCAAWADVSVVTQIHPSYVGSTITAVATRDGVDLATAECTTATNTSGFAKATASLDLSGAGAGYVQVAFLDEFGDPVSTGTEFEIDGSGDPVDRLAFIDAATSSRLAPTESGRTLDVTANGNAGIDWGNIDNPTTSINFSSTTVGTATNVGGASLRSGLGMAAANMDTQFSSITFDDNDLQEALGEVAGEVAAIKTKTDFLPSATAGQNGGLPTVDGNNRVAGIQGTITTLDALDTAQDSQHTATQNALATVDSNVDSILEDTGTTLPGTLSGLATSAALTSVGNNVTAILEDTGTTLPGTLSTIDGNVDAILEDTGTTIPGTLSGLATSTALATVDSNLDDVKAKTDQLTFTESNKVDATAAVALESEDIDAIADATASAVGEGLGEAVWTYTDRELTSGANIVLAKGTGITGFTDLDAAGVRGAVGLASANLDTQLSSVDFDDTDILNAIAVVDLNVDHIKTAFQLDGAVWQLTTNALENGGAVSLDPEDIDLIAAAAADAVGAGIGESVWTYTDRELTSGANIVLAKGVGLTGLNDISVTNIFAAQLTDHDDVGSMGRAIGDTLTNGEATLTGVGTVSELIGTPAGSSLAADVAATRDAVEDLETVETTLQPRVNRPAGRAFQLKIPSRSTGKYVATPTVKLRPGAVGDKAIAVDMAALFGELRVLEVGTPVVSGGGITAEALGPRDDGARRDAMIEIDGLATAGEERTVEVEVTMETGESETVVIEIEVFSE